MKNYIGTELVKATPMNRLDYNNFRDYGALPDDLNGNDEGYLVEFIDGRPPNHKDFDGYIFWALKERFENTFRETKGLSFGIAIEALKKGLKVSREGWNGKGMFLFLVPESIFKVSHTPLVGISLDGTEVEYRSHINMKTVDGQIVPWVASQTDVLADDWEII